MPGEVWPENVPPPTATNFMPYEEVLVKVTVNFCDALYQPMFGEMAKTHLVVDVE